ncbi:MAG TPA: ATP-binding cassette domain-containing protein [Polyangiaceae bacterium]
MEPERVASRPIVDVRGLTIGWGDRVVTRDVTFHVDRGEVVAILGESGSGKTTLMRFIIGLEQPLEGVVDVAGRGHPDLEQGLPPFGVMFQSGALFGSMTVGDNVRLPLREWTDLPPDAITAIARGKLRTVDLEDAIDKLPAELSGGMVRRAAIARALALDPELVFLDEPSAGLDPRTEAEIDDLIVTLNRALGVTIVMITHELESVYRIADRCVVLDARSKSVLAVGDPRRMRDSGDPRIHAFFHPAPVSARERAPR